MQFFSHPIPAVVILLGLLVFVHELGHFVIARLSGIAVEVFSIGFGPKIFGFTFRGTNYRLSWLPLGGYVKFAGAHPKEVVPPGVRGVGMLSASLPRRALTVLAGPMANFALAVVVFAALGRMGVSHPPAEIGEVIDGTPAWKAGLRYGDKILSIDGARIKTWREMEEKIASSPEKKLTITIDRAGQSMTVDVTPMAVAAQDRTGRAATIGRAGVAHGKLPAILSITDPILAAAVAGISTGDVVTQMTLPDASYEVRYYSEFLDYLMRAAHDAETRTVTLKVHKAEIPVVDELGEGRAPSPKAASGGANERTLILDIGAARSLSQGASPKAVAQALGFRDAQLTVASAEAPTNQALRQGDTILSWNGRAVSDIFGLHEQLMANTADKAQLSVLRDFAPMTIEVPLKGIEAQKPEGPVTIFALPVQFWGQAIEPEPLVERYDTISGALLYGLKETAHETGELMRNIASLFSGAVPLKALGGPMLIAKVAGDSARRGLQTFLSSMALISINLGLLNLFPIPVLDGGQLVLMLAEGIKRRPLRESAVENFQKVGFAMIMALVVLATYNDLSRFWRSMLKSVVGLFQ